MHTSDREILHLMRSIAPFVPETEKPTLPHELYRDIAENVIERYVLKCLAQVSPAFQAEAERILWSYVSLKPPCVPWGPGTCEALYERTNVLTKRTAKFVEVLDIVGSPSSVPVSKAAFRRFHPALQRMSRVRVLRIRAIDLQSFCPSSSDPTTLPFSFPSLEHLSCQASFDVLLWNFMKSHPNVRLLHLECAPNNSTFGDFYNSTSPELRAEIDNRSPTSPLFPALECVAICSSLVPTLLWRLGPVKHLTIRFDEFAKRSPEMLYDAYRDCQKSEMKSVEKLRIYGLKNIYFNRMLETMYQYMPNVEDIGGVTTSDDTIEALCEFLSTFQRLHRIDMVYDGMMWEEKFRAGLGVMRQYCPLMDHVTLWALGDAYYDKWTAVRETTNASWTWKIDNCKECTRHEEISPALLS